MVIEKLLHSCLRLTEGDARLLIDPGVFCFVEGKLTREDLGRVDVVLLTHEHADHFDVDALRAVVAAGEPTILSHPSLAAKVREAGFPCEAIEPGETRTVGTFVVTAIDAPHGRLPFPTPPNTGYLINDHVYHPGDSLTPPPRTVAVYALPIAGPWMALADAIDVAVVARPKIIIPIHDAIIKEFFLDRMYWMVEEGLKGTGIASHPLAIGERLEA